MTADPWLMAMSLSSTLDPERLLHAVRVHGMAPERLAESWRELVTRVVSCPGGSPRADDSAGGGNPWTESGQSNQCSLNYS